MKKTLDQKIAAAMEYLQEKHCLDSASTYGEPGYTDPERGILFANWNDVPSGMQKWLEQIGFELEWSDEWCQVDDKAYRTSPDSYGWESQVMLPPEACEYITPNELPEWIEACRVNSVSQSIQALPSWFPTDEILSAGYELKETGKQTGLHTGMNDDPATEVKKYMADGAEYVLFQRSQQSQFYTEWQIWVKMPETGDTNEGEKA